MSPGQNRILWLVFVFTALAICLVVYAKTTVKPGTVPTASAPAPNSPATVDVQRQYVRRGRLWPQLRWNLEALGNRLEQSGKERLALTGTISQPNRIQPANFVLIWELPGRARLTIQDHDGHRTLVFNGQSVQTRDGQIEQSDRVLLETLIYDSPERLFIAAQENPSRLIGQRFRTDDGTNDSYAGPFYDIYQLTDIVKTEATSRQETRLYYFNSDTQLLESIRYTTERRGLPTPIEVKIGQWSRSSDQQVARRITRVENNSLILTIDTADDRRPDRHSNERQAPRLSTVW